MTNPGSETCSAPAAGVVGSLYYRHMEAPDYRLVTDPCPFRAVKFFTTPLGIPYAFCGKHVSRNYQGPGWKEVSWDEYAVAATMEG